MPTSCGPAQEAAAALGGGVGRNEVRLVEDHVPEEPGEEDLVSTNPAAERRRRLLRRAAAGLAAALALGLALTDRTASVRTRSASATSSTGNVAAAAV
jgi:hypothetical protein